MVFAVGAVLAVSLDTKCRVSSLSDVMFVAYCLPLEITLYHYSGMELRVVYAVGAVLAVSLDAKCRVFSLADAMFAAYCACWKHTLLNSWCESAVYAVCAVSQRV